MIVVDAHEDLAYNALTFGRDYARAVADTRAAEEGLPVIRQNGHTLIGWPDWVRGRVGLVFATLFAAPLHRRLGDWDKLVYADATEAHRIYWSQIDFYRRFVEEMEGRLELVVDRAGLARMKEAWADGSRAGDKVGLVCLMEGADGVREPVELEAWYEAGVRILGPAWSATRYAGGTGEPGPFNDEGRALMDVMGELGMILDISHLSDEGALEALDRFSGALIASHANPRALLPHSRAPERHLSDEVIRGVAEREGVVGIVLGNRFIKDGWTESDGRQAVGLVDVIAHIDYVCQLVGDARHVGLGSDFDGGFGLDKVPAGLDSVADLRKIGPALEGAGYSEEDAQAVLGTNWLRLLDRALPDV